MDIVLEVVDTFALDHVYAYLLPNTNAHYNQYLADGVNKTVEAVSNAWEWTPASEYFNVAPGPAAWASAWPRDYILRQFISLFAITWFVSSIHLQACKN